MAEHDRATTTLEWSKPGPGVWAWDAAHSPRPATPFVQQLLGTTVPAGFRDFTSRYGCAMSHLDVEFVNGYAYVSPRIANVPAKDGPPPPPAVLKVITRLDPRWRKLERAARRTLAEETWRADVARWTGSLRPAAVAELRSRQRLLDQLDDVELAAELDAAVAAALDVSRTHFALIGSYALPLGLLLVFLRERGIDPSEGVALLAGSGSGTTAPRDALARVAAALPPGSTPRTLDDVRNASPEAAAALDAYLDEYGWRLVGGLDIDRPCQIELPEMILESVRSLLAGRTADRMADDPAGLRARVPAADRAALDRLLADARAVYGSRDDHAGFILWAAGIVRRDLLEAASRLVERGELASADDVFLLAPAEVSAALAGRAPVPPDVTERRARRAAAATSTPPPILGTPTEPPPPGSLPATVERVSEAVRLVAELLDRPVADAGAGSAANPHDGWGGRAVRGLGIGTASYRGRARVALDAFDAMATVEPGDVLVTACTTPAFNATFEVVGALVTAEGGALSHPAFMARELGLVAVIGAPEALRVIRDGDEVEVDPVAGVVRVV